MLKYLKSKGRSLTIMVKKCIFIGYSEKSKACKLYNLLAKKLMVSRDVVFNEAEARYWSNEEIVKEQPVVNEPDEPLHEVPPPATSPSPQHAKKLVVSRDVFNEAEA